MVQDLSQQARGKGPAGPRQAVAGLMPPQLGEALIREVWPTVVHAQPAVAGLAKRLIRSVFLAPLGWLVQAPLFLKKFAPMICERYTLTNQRLMVQRGWKPAPHQQVPLEQIDDVRDDPAAYDPFYHCGTLEVISGDKVVLRLTGVPEPEGFRHAILNAVRAWVPGKAKGPFLPASAEVKA
jgi:hypothetical protein